MKYLKSQETDIKTFRKIDNFSFGKNLKKIRLGKNVSRQELGDALGVGVNQIFRYEKGEHGVSVDKLREICEFLNVSPERLLGIRLLDAREHLMPGIIYDWEIRHSGVYWICPNCNIINVRYGEEHKKQLNKNELECECENCGKYFNQFWENK